MFVVRRVPLLALVLCVLAVPASSALAGKKGASPPSVTSLTPLALRVGDTLTIRGRNFVPGKKRDKVTFKRDGGPAVTVKAAEATRTRLKVVVPAALAKYVTAAGGAARALRFRVRVVAGRAASKGYTTLKSSPVIVPANVPAAALDQLGALDDSCGIDTGGVIDGIEGDAGTASDVSDLAAATDPCLLDTTQDDLSVDGQ
jgi:hypothetical protein